MVLGLLREIMSTLPELPKSPNVHSDAEVGRIQINHFELARRGLDISYKAQQVSKEVRDSLLSTWSKLGNQASGPEPAGMDGTAESA